MQAVIKKINSTIEEVLVNNVCYITIEKCGKSYAVIEESAFTKAVYNTLNLSRCHTMCYSKREAMQHVMEQLRKIAKVI